MQQENVYSDTEVSQVQIISRAGHAMLGRCGPRQRLKQRLCANLPDQVAYDRCQLHHIANNLLLLLAPLYMIMSSLQAVPLTKNSQPSDPGMALRLS